MATYEIPNETGNILSGVTLITGDTMRLKDGGEAQDTTVDDGRLNVDDGGYVSKTLVSSGGYMRVSNGAIASNTTVGSNGSMWVGATGSAGETTMSGWGGSMNILGTATDVLVTGGGSMTVANGGTVKDATLIDYGYALFEKGATGNNVSVGLGGYLSVANGATANIVENGGYVNVVEGANAVFANHTFSDLVIPYNDTTTVHSGTTAFAVKDNGLMMVCGGYASGTVVDNYGSMGISGGVASNTTIQGGGYMEIADGTVKGLSIQQGAATIYGGTTTDLTLGEWGSLVLYVNKVVNTKVSGKSADGTDILLEEGKISDYTMVNNGRIVLASGGVADNITVKGGTILISEDGTLTNATFVGRTSGGVAWLTKGGTVENALFESGTGLHVSDGGGTVKNVSAHGGTISATAGTFQNTLVTSGGTMTLRGTVEATGTVLSNGIVTSTSDDESRTWESVEGGTLIISAGAFARETTVWDSATFQLAQNGKATDTFLKSGGAMVINSGGTAANVTVSGGAFLSIESGGTVSDLNVSEGGRIAMQITSDTNLSGKYAGNAFTVTNVLTGAIGAGFQYTVFNGGSVNAESFALNKDEVLYLYDGGAFEGALTVNAGGTAAFYSGKATATVTENGGAFYYSDYNNDLKITFEANTINDLKLEAGNSATVHSNTVANRTVIRGVPDPNNSGTWSEMDVYQGGIVNDTEVFECGELYVSGHNGIASAVRTNVHSGGSFYLYESAYASETVVSDGGAFDVGYKTSAFHNTVKETGSMAIWGNGVASTTLVTSGGSMTVYNGGSAYDTTVESGAAVTIEGKAYDTIIESTGTLHVTAGGSASTVTVRKGGRLDVATGGVLAGDVTFDDGGQLYFDLNGLNPGTRIMVGDLSGIDGNPDYRIVIAPETQALGDYTFASGAEGFAGTMTVVDAEFGTELGALKAGESLEIREGVYATLTLADNDLVLTVGDTPVTHDDGPDKGWNKDPFDKKRKTLDAAVYEFNMNYLYAGMMNPELLLDSPNSVKVVDEERGKEWHNFVGKGTNAEGEVLVDEYDFAMLTLNNAAKVSLTVTATDKAKVTIYSVVATGSNSEGETTYTRKAVQTTALKWDKDAKVYTVDTKSLLLDRTLSGSGYFISVQSTNANARTNPGSAFYNVEVNNKVVKGKEQTHYYSDGDDNLDDWLCNKAGERNYRVAMTFLPVSVNSLTAKIQVDDEGIHHTHTDLQKNVVEFNNFVGFGDAADYRRLVLTSPMLLSFSITATDKAKVVISRIDYNEKTQKYTEKKLQTTALKLDKTTGLYKIDTAACKLPANNSDGQTGVYYISVQSTNAKTGGEAYYNVTVNSSASTFYVDSDDGTNGWLYNKKTDAANYNTSLKSNDIVSGANPICLEAGTFEAMVNIDGNDVTFNNFVGFGDEYDYAEIKLTSAGTLAFSVDAFSKCSVKNASQNLKFTVYSLTKVVRGEKVTWTQKSLASGTITIDRKAGYVEDATLKKAIAIRDATSDDVKYFVSVQSVGSKNGAEVFYNVTATFTPEGSDGAALAMPETAALSLTDDLSFGQYAAESDALAGAAASSLAELDEVSVWQNLALA